MKKIIYILILSIFLISLSWCEYKWIKNDFSNTKNSVNKNITNSSSSNDNNNSNTKNSVNNIIVSKENKWKKFIEDIKKYIWKIKWNWNIFVWFTATWCPHCQKVVPIFDEFYKENENNINMMINVLNKKKFPWINFLPQNYKNPHDYKYYTNDNCTKIPSYIILNKNWKIIEKECWWKLTFWHLRKMLLKK